MTHKSIEHKLLTGQDPELNIVLEPYWKSIKPFLKTVRKPVLIEGALWHPDKFAGTADCVAYLEDDDSQPSLLDWKTADSKRRPDKIYEYSLQLAAYRAALNYVYGHIGLDITRARLVVAVRDQHAQIETFDAEALDQLYLHFKYRLETYSNSRRKAS